VCVCVCACSPQDNGINCYLSDGLVGIQATHAVLERGEDSALDVQGPHLIVLRGTQLVHYTVLEGKAQGLSLQHGGGTSGLGGTAHAL